MVDDIEARLALLPVHRGDVHAVAEVLFVLQVPRHRDDLLALHDHGDLAGEFLRGDDGVRHAV